MKTDEDQKTKFMEAMNEKACEILADVKFKTAADQIKAIENISGYLQNVQSTEKEEIEGDFATMSRRLLDLVPSGEDPAAEEIYNILEHWRDLLLALPFRIQGAKTINDLMKKVELNTRFSSSQNKIVKQLLIETSIISGTDTFIILESDRMKWSRETFTEATGLSSLLKAQDEIKEIMADLENGHCRSEEYVDAIMCLFDSAGRRNITPMEILFGYKTKTEVNKSREWIKNPDNTYSHKKK